MGRFTPVAVGWICIEQADTQLDLQCLAIFLLGGNVLLVSSGSTFTCRLRCSLGSFAYVNVFVEDEFRTPPFILTL